MRITAGDSFAYKITVLALLVTSIAAVTLMAAFLAFDSVNARAQLEARLRTLADVVSQNSTAALNFEDRAAATEVLQALRAESPVVSGCLYDMSGHLFASYQRQSGNYGCATQLHGVVTYESGYSSVIRDVERHGEFLGTLCLKSDLQDLGKPWRHLLQVMGVLLLVSLIVGGVSGSLLQRQISRPVHDLALAMNEVTQQQNFAVRVQVSGRDEMAQLSSGFNTMLSELQERDRGKKKVEAQLQHQALNDELTGLPNRRLLADRLSQALAVGKREGRCVALLYIDLDGFKLVNDSLGHTTGDLLLGQVAQRLRSRIRSSDTLARLGGDEFSTVLTGLHIKEHAGIVATTLLEALAAPFIIEGHEINISASIGVSIFPDDGVNASDLLQQADSAMYAAKRAGKNQMMYFTRELGLSVRERLNLENQLRLAVAHGQISVQYQPEFDATSLRPVRFEALARWNHPTLGAIPPAKFIPIAEESGLIVPLGVYIMEKACADAVQWQKISPHPVQVAVNVSSIQFARDTFVDEVAEVLRQTGLPAHLLQIELTESVMLSGASHTAEAMNRLRAQGISLAIDDFGTGYSCLAYLPKLPFDALKIDRSFVNDLESRPEVRAMVRSLVALAHNLGMKVIVEGVETEKQFQAIAELGSNEIQGYLLGRPTSDPISQLQAHELLNKNECAAPGQQEESLDPPRL
jgi:diguanylate cyclase (GGDEF)-like protein